MKTQVALMSVGLALGLCAADTPVKSSESAPAAAPAFVNDICLPSSLYLLSDVQNDLFVQPFIKRWRPYDDYRLASGAAAVPFEKCPGDEKLRIQAGNPHPYPNYPAMSIPFAAFIQYHR